MKLRRFSTLLLALLLTVALILTGCASDENANNDNGNNVTGDNNADTDTNNDNNTGDNTGSADFTRYDDLAGYAKLLFREVYFSFPTQWRCDSEPGGFSITDNKDYALIVSFNDSEEPVYSGDLQNILDDSSDEFVNVINRTHPGTDESFTPDSAEVVTLSNGRQALLFTGAIANPSVPDKTYPVYGYSFVYNGTASMTIGYFIDGDNPQEYESMLKDYVDRMVLTVRDEA